MASTMLTPNYTRRSQAASTIQRSWRSNRSRLSAHPLSRHKSSVISRSSATSQGVSALSGITRADYTTPITQACLQTTVRPSVSKLSTQKTASGMTSSECGVSKSSKFTRRSPRSRPLLFQDLCASQQDRFLHGHDDQSRQDKSMVSCHKIGCLKLHPSKPVVIDISSDIVEKKESNTCCWILLAAAGVIIFLLVCGAIYFFTRPKKSTDDSSEEAVIFSPCPFCQQKFGKGKLEAHKRSCPKAKCRYCKADYSQKGLTALQNHEPVCPSRPPSITYKKCRWCHREFPWNKKDAHERKCGSNPANMRKTCRYCDKNFPLDKITTHEKSCPNRSRCPFCNKYFRADEIETHKKNCTMRPKDSGYMVSGAGSPKVNGYYYERYYDEPKMFKSWVYGGQTFSKYRDSHNPNYGKPTGHNITYHVQNIANSIPYYVNDNGCFIVRHLRVWILVDPSNASTPVYKNTSARNTVVCPNNNGTWRPESGRLPVPGIKACPNGI